MFIYQKYVKCSANKYWVLSTVLGTEDTEADKTGKIPTLMEVRLGQGNEQIGIYNMMSGSDKSYKEK